MPDHPVAAAGPSLTCLPLARCFLLPWIAMALALTTAPAGAPVLCGPSGKPARDHLPSGGPDAAPCIHGASRRETIPDA